MTSSAETVNDHRGGSTSSSFSSPASRIRSARSMRSGHSRGTGCLPLDTRPVVALADSAWKDPGGETGLALASRSRRNAPWD